MKVIFLCIMSITISSCSQSRYIPYQAHGFNDFDYFIQLLKKGVDLFKMDISPQVKSSCLQYSSWVESDNQCEVFSSGYEICCLAFRGDTSSTPIFKQPFNTTIEFIQLLKNNKYLFQGKKRILAINFQFHDPMSLQAKNFLYQLFKTIEQENLQLEMITGTDNFVFSYLEKCALKKCNEIEQYIADQPLYLQSNSYDQENDRYRNYNTFYEYVTTLCEYGVPSWVDKFNYPLIFWEPSHEYQVQYVRYHLERPDCKISNKYKQIENIRIASNLEPEMVSIYWKKAVVGLNENFNPDDEKAIIYGDYYDSAIDYNQKCNYLILGLNRHSSQSIMRVYNATTFKIVKEILVDFKINYVRGQKDMVLIQGETDGLLYTLDDECKIEQIQQFNLGDSELISLSYHSNEIIYLELNEQEKEIELIFKDIETGVENARFSQEMGPVLGSTPLNVMFDAFYSTTTEQYYIALTFTKYSLDIEQKTQSNSLYKKIYMSLLTLKKDYTLVEYLPALSPIDLGTTNDLKLYEFNGKMYLLAVHSNGLCQSAILLNNNEWNKCIYENLPEYQAMQNVEYMINYFWGQLEEMKQRLRDGIKISGCDKSIMHSKLQNGANPTITLRQREDDVIDAFVLTDFIHYKKQGTLTQLFCGSSNDFDNEDDNGLLLFSFDLLHYDAL